MPDRLPATHIGGLYVDSDARMLRGSQNRHSSARHARELACHAYCCIYTETGQSRHVAGFARIQLGSDFR